MAAYTPAFTAEESEDGLTITLTDTSNWADNDENYNKLDFTRSFILKDANNNILTTLTLVGGVDTTTYTLTKPTWLTIQYSAVGVVTYNLVQKYGFLRIYINRLQENLIELGSKRDLTKITNLNTSTSFYLGAIGVEPVGNSAGWQIDMDIAMIYLGKVGC